MRAHVVRAAGAALLIVPTVLAFFAGGDLPTARDTAGLVARSLVVVALLADRHRLPRSRPSLIAIGGLASLACWTLASTLWAPIAGAAYAGGQVAFVYLGALVAGVLLLRDRVVARAVEPVLALGGRSW